MSSYTDDALKAHEKKRRVKKKIKFILWMAHELEPLSTWDES